MSKIPKSVCAILLALSLAACSGAHVPKEKYSVTWMDLFDTVITIGHMGSY